jgi:hypothetical protein
MSTDIAPRRLAALAEDIRAELDAFEVARQSALEHALTAGKKLIEAKSLVQHGEWISWLETNFPYTRRWASACMRLARHRHDLPYGNELPISHALALIAEPKAPPAPADNGTRAPRPDAHEPPLGHQPHADTNLLGEPVPATDQAERRETSEGPEEPAPQQLKHPATERQLAYLRSLCRRRGVEMCAGPLSKNRASRLIDELSATPAQLDARAWVKRLRALVEEIEAVAPVGGEFLAAQALVARLARVIGGMGAPVEVTAVHGRKWTDDELQALIDAAERGAE